MRRAGAGARAGWRGESSDGAGGGAGTEAWDCAATGRGSTWTDVWTGRAGAPAHAVGAATAAATPSTRNAPAVCASRRRAAMSVAWRAALYQESDTKTLGPPLRQRTGCVGGDGAGAAGGDERRLGSNRKGGERDQLPRLIYGADDRRAEWQNSKLLMRTRQWAARCVLTASNRRETDSAPQAWKPAPKPRRACCRPG